MSGSPENPTIRKVTEPSAARPLALEPLEPIQGSRPILTPQYGLITREHLQQIYADEIATVMEDARRTGFEEGLSRGVSEATEQARMEAAELSKRQKESEAALAERLSRLDATVEGLRAQRSAFFHEAEGALVELAYGCLVKMLGDMASDVSLVRGLVQTAMESVALDGPLTVRVSVGDHFLLADSGALDQLRDKGLARVVADPHLGAGDCLIESPRGVLDAGLKTQLETLAVVLARAHQDRRRPDASLAG